MSKTKEPTWLLDKNWGASVDAYNWILKYRAPDAKSWVNKGYYPDPSKMLKSMYRQLCRTETPDPNLLNHLNGLQELVTASAERLSAELNAMAWAHLSRPPAHPKRSSKT